MKGSSTRIAYKVTFSYNSGDYSVTEYLSEADNSASTYKSGYSNNTSTYYYLSMAQDTGTTNFTGTAPTVDTDDNDGLAFPFTRSAVQEEYLSHINLGLVQTVTLGGTVWEEDTIDGLYDSSSEDGVGSVTVTVLKCLVDYSSSTGDYGGDRTVLTRMVTYSTSTGSDGKWSISALPLTLTESQSNMVYSNSINPHLVGKTYLEILNMSGYRVAYVVQFTYETDDYTVTEYMADASGTDVFSKSQVYRSACVNDEADEYYDNSVALDVDNDKNSGTAYTGSGVVSVKVAYPVAKGYTDSDYMSNINLGLVHTIDLAGYVWRDADLDGLVDSGESAISGVSVTFSKVLVQSYETSDTYSDTIIATLNSTTIDATDKTDSDGLYEFFNLHMTLNLDEEYLTLSDGTYYKDAVKSGKYRVAYNITFSYNNSNYSVTEYLASAGNSSSAFLAAYHSSSSLSNTYLKNSMARDTGSNSFLGTASTYTDSLGGMTYPFAMSTDQEDYLSYINLGLAHTIDLAGYVWEEDVLDGLMASDELKVEDIKVTVYKAIIQTTDDYTDSVVVTLAKSYETSTYSSEGVWRVNDVPLTLTNYEASQTCTYNGLTITYQDLVGMDDFRVAYYVEFEYCNEGNSDFPYTPTWYLVETSNSPQNFLSTYFSSGTTGISGYLDNSMAKDTGTDTFTGTASTMTSSGGLAYPFDKSDSQQDYMQQVNLGLLETVDLGGTVWSEILVDGEMDSDESGIEEIEVTVSKALVKTTDDGDDEIVYTFAYGTTKTNSNGYWSVSDLPIKLTNYEETAVQFELTTDESIVDAWVAERASSDGYRIAWYVTFEFDEDTYVMTEYLAETENSASEFMTAFNGSGVTDYLDNSMGDLTAEGVAETASSTLNGLAYPFANSRQYSLQVARRSTSTDYMFHINLGLIPKIELGGTVWDDSEDEDGVLDDGESGIEGVEVTVSRVVVLRNSDGTDVEQEVLTENVWTGYTDENGEWSTGEILWPWFTYSESVSEDPYDYTLRKYSTWRGDYRVAYNVTFTYDGQTYTTTEYLEYSSGSASSFIAAEYTARSGWSNDSTAQENETDRIDFDNKFATITGDEWMDSSSPYTTYGTATDIDGSTKTELEYEFDFDSKESTLVTLDENNRALEQYRFSVATDTSADASDKTAGGITYPCDYSSTQYSYLTDINLGLVKRDESDIEVEKELSQAIVVVNGKAMTYDFSNITDYTINLYSSDYNYRVDSSYYSSDILSELNSYYNSSFGYSTAADALEMEIYLTFTITIYNRSTAYDVTINQINDYYDSDLTLVSTSSRGEVYLEDTGKTQVVDTPYISYYDSSGNLIKTNDTTWINSGATRTSSGNKFYKSHTKLGSVISAESCATITTSYKVNKDSSSSLETGYIYNEAEIASYSTYYTKTEINAGKIDKDSAPDNTPILLDTDYHEDDTAITQVYITPSDKMDNTDRLISGLVWEDSQNYSDGIKYNQIIGDGIYDSEPVIEGITVELYEVKEITDSSGTTTYYYCYIDETETDSSGGYSFDKLYAGNYVVRFVYGATDDTICHNTDGTSETKIYSGQDYKSTTYQAGIDNDLDDDGYVDTIYDVSSNDTTRYSDARDSEARRLEVAAMSEILTYSNSSILATADDISADHTDLYDYYMFADTAIFDLEIEDVYGYYGSPTGSALSKTTQCEAEIYTIEDPTTFNANTYTYEVARVDFGIEERSATTIILDKQIKEIVFATSDGEVILDAIYDIDYTISDETVTSDVSINESESIGYTNIASLNRQGSMQGYRYIMVDSTIMQGATITIQYQFATFNVGEADTCTQDLEDIWDEINTYGTTDKYDYAMEALGYDYNATAAVEQYEASNYVYGAYFGKVYYSGANTKMGVNLYDNAILVKTTIRQIIDYIDPDVEFSEASNDTTDQAWSTTTIDYLLENGLIDPSAVIIIDGNGDPVFKLDTDDEDSDGSTKDYLDVVTLADSITTSTPIVHVSSATYYYSSTTGYYMDDSSYSSWIEWVTSSEDILSFDSNGNVVVTYPTDTDEYSAEGVSYAILNDDVQKYITSTKNNVVLSLEDETVNSDLLTGTIPYSAYTTMSSTEQVSNTYSTSIELQTSRYFSSENDETDIDNIGEIIKVENTVGRRDSKSTQGDIVTYQLEDDYSDYNNSEIPTHTKEIYEIAGTQSDASATELITLTPPTGLGITETIEEFKTEIYVVIVIAAVIVVIGIILIKKKVLNQRR